MKVHKPSSPILTAENLTRIYGKAKSSFRAVSDLSFHVNPGEVYGLLGTNGAGKTSTLEMLEGLTAADSGQISVFGLDPFIKRDQVRPEMGIMLQSGGLPPQLTVRETLTMWAGTCSHPLDIDTVLAEVQLTHRTEVKVGSLSGGEQRRLDLGCALVGDPCLLFLDEPTTGLDPESRRNVWQLLTTLKKRGVTMILTTHYLEEAEMLCDRLAIMHEGRFAAEGTLEELVATTSASISFRSHAHPPQLPGTTVIAEGSQITIHTKDLQGDAYRVLNWAAEHGHALEQFSARPASLNQVFLNIADSHTDTL